MSATLPAGIQQYSAAATEAQGKAEAALEKVRNILKEIPKTRGATEQEAAAMLAEIEGAKAAVAAAESAVVSAEEVAGDTPSNAANEELRKIKEAKAAAKTAARDAKMQSEEREKYGVSNAKQASKGETHYITVIEKDGTYTTHDQSEGASKGGKRKRTHKRTHNRKHRHHKRKRTHRKRTHRKQSHRQ